MREIINISGVGSELQGVGRLQDGRAVFVPGALPGERVEIEIVRDAKRFCEARLVRVIETSPVRANSFCPHVARCGGCAARHMRYEATLELKRRRVIDALERIGGVTAPVVRATIGCATPERCRNKAEYAVELRGGELRVGPTEARSHRVLPVEDCLLQTPQSVRALRWIAAHLGEFACAPHIRYLVTRTSRAGELAIVLSGDAHPQGDLHKLAEAIRRDLPELISVHYCKLRPRPAHALDGICTRVLGAEAMTDHLLGLSFELSPQSFFQVNPPQAEALYLRALEAIGLGEGEGGISSMAKPEANEHGVSSANSEAPMNRAPVMPQANERGAFRADGEAPLECAPILPQANEGGAFRSDGEAPLECAPIMPQADEHGVSSANGEAPMNRAPIMPQADEGGAFRSDGEAPLECAPIMPQANEGGAFCANGEAPMNRTMVMPQTDECGAFRADSAAASPREGEGLRVLDAYCGAGTITLAAAARGARCVGVEIVAPAIENARRNAERNGLADRVRFLCGDAAREIPRLIERGERFDAAILDPPRKGADAALLNALADARIPRIAYVSCDPGTLARDVKLLAARGYALEWAQPVDMFPWTGHIETAACLVRE